VTTTSLASSTGTGSVVLSTSPTITTPVISSLSSASATALTLQSAGTTAITVDTSQNVGIGTASPTYKLNVTATNTSGDNGAIFLTSPSTDGTQFRINNTGSGGHSYTFYSAGSGNSIGAGALGIYDQTSGAYRTTITSGGDFVVAGPVAVPPTTSFGKISSTGIFQSGRTGTGSQPAAEFFNGNSNVGSIYTSGSNTSYNTSSDYRLKENIAPMTGALAKVALLKPSTYKWKVDGADGEGFIAHELAEVFPQAVTGQKDEIDEDEKPKYQSIDTSFLIATLTAALQETKALIDTQAETINALTARIEALENR
jgi:hypothetical protein